MADATMTSTVFNVGLLLDEVAVVRPDATAIAVAGKRDVQGKRQYETITFAQLAHDSTVIAAGLSKMGVVPGTRLAMMVRPGIDFVSLVFALFKVGAVSILIDPGMGKKNVLSCLDQVQPEGFVAIPIVHAVRKLCGRRYQAAKLNVTVGRKWFWGGATLEQLRQTDIGEFQPFESTADDKAAIIFTSGSTGPPKGGEFRHEGFRRQVQFIQERYAIEPGEIDVPGFPLFGLFNSAMGVTSVIPDMDFSCPAAVDPRNILEAITDWKATQSFASPAVWNAVGQFCERENLWMPSLRRVLSAGAPVPPHVLKRMKKAAPNAEMYTPYGATEALPVASIAASEVLGETNERSREGAGTCVGSRFEGIDWQVIAISDEAIETVEQVEPLPRGEIGELIVRGPVITRRYATSDEATRNSKIYDGDAVWHRMGDVGYLDTHDRFWFCGRKTHRLQTAQGPMFTIPVESIFNTHEKIFRSALVGLGEPGDEVPVVIVQPWPGMYPDTPQEIDQLMDQLREIGNKNALTERIDHFLLHPNFPVDVRHNSKIFREKLKVWAEERIETGSPQ
ncbi:fatty acid CoA ligase family protein [Bremerella alba]|uniref:Long-chain-fatty-acid--CoA ligase FadD13 n=1 Tax=Bremerella alba TaxID=980252 RepID=A0A7V9A687_9BACT|nr:fatty acid CoA ligase family protein [Bremerella alba]MBA2114002.1 Long-chain-fatty-acid--CoA ligase FadD13 [Bremerella alba]